VNKINFQKKSEKVHTTSPAFGRILGKWSRTYPECSMERLRDQMETSGTIIADDHVGHSSESIAVRTPKI